MGGGRTPIHFGTHNIRNRQNGGLELALRRMVQSNMDARVFQEKKIIDGIYTHVLSGHSVVATSAPSQADTASC